MKKKVILIVSCCSIMLALSITSISIKAALPEDPGCGFCVRQKTSGVYGKTAVKDDDAKCYQSGNLCTEDIEKCTLGGEQCQPMICWTTSSSCTTDAPAEQ